MLVLDVLWWLVAMRLTKRTLGRVLLSLFMAVQTAGHVVAMAGVDDLLRRIPKAIVVALYVWHWLVIGLPCAILFVLGIRRLRAWLRPPVPAEPATGGGQTRREFVGTCAAAAPALLTVGLSGVGLAQLNQFRVRRFTLPVAALPRALDGMTLAHVSDIHVGRLTCGRVLRDMVNVTNALKADLVLLTGDLIHYELADLSEGIAVVQAMQGRYGQWMVEGNHDLFDDGAEFRRRVKAAGVPLLLDEVGVAEVRGYPVQCFGLGWQERDRGTALQVRALMKQRQPDAFPILLAHHPHVFDAAAAAELPLTLAGHTHGGQWMLDRRHGVGPILFRYWSGLYARRGSQMIVSNGVGNVFPIRVNAPAEIVHITLRCAV